MSPEKENKAGKFVNQQTGKERLFPAAAAATGELQFCKENEISQRHEW